MATIPFNQPATSGREFEYILMTIMERDLSGDGEVTKRCHRFLERELGVPKVLLTTSCTHALEMCAILLGFGEGDEVIVPSFTFVSTPNAFVLHKAKPVFVDVRPDTLNLDEGQLEEAMTPRTKAVVPVHYAGVGCEMDTILGIAQKHGVKVVEDNAHGLFGRYKGRPLGSMGCLATQSFHETKNFTCGEGGALIINQMEFYGRAEIIREKGTDRSRFYRGEVDKYTWMDIGSSFLPSGILAAFLMAQLEAWKPIQEKRAMIWKRYDRHLRPWGRENGVVLPSVPCHCDQAYHMYWMLLPDLEQRQRLIDHLRKRDIQAAFHYMPLHLSKMGRSFGGREGQFPVTERVADQIVRLPFYNSMADSEIDQVVEAVLEFRV